MIQSNPNGKDKDKDKLPKVTREEKTSTIKKIT